MKRILTILCTMALAMTCAVPALAAAENPSAFYPVEVEEYMEGESPRIRKVYQLALSDDPAQIPTEDFERDGRLYFLLDMTREDSVGVVTRPHIETITAKSDTDAIQKVLAQLDAGADTNPFQQSLTEGEPNVTYGMVKFTGDLTQVYFDYFIPRDVHETESGGTACVMDTETYLVIDYLPDNGPIVDLSIHDENYPAGEDLDTVTQNFIAQLDTTIPGQWQQTTTPEDDPTYQRYLYAHDSGVLRVTSHHIHQQDFSLAVMLEPAVYGSLYTLNNLAHDPYGQTYTAPQK